jgi:four helix bundle protein
MGKYQDLLIFQKSDELAFRIYKVTESFPKSELFGLSAQMRRAALSIPTNIVEGYARRSRKELKQYINISLGSLAETRYLFDFSKRLQYHKNSSQTAGLIEEVGRMLWSFYRTL